MDKPTLDSSMGHDGHEERERDAARSRGCQGKRRIVVNFVA